MMRSNRDDMSAAGMNPTGMNPTGMNTTGGMNTPGMGADDMRDRNDSSDRSGEPQRPRLIHLKDADDLQVADGDQDIRGWDLRTTDGQKIGTVDDLLVDTARMKVQYIEAQLDRDDGDDSGDDRHVLIPIASARLDDKNDDVLIDFSTLDARSIPTYDRQAMPLADMPFHEQVDDRQFFGSRRLGREDSSYIAPMSDRRDMTGRRSDSELL